MLLVLALAATGTSAQTRQQPIDLFSEKLPPDARPLAGRAIPGVRPETVGAVGYFALTPAGTTTMRAAFSATLPPVRIALPNGGTVVCTLASEPRPRGLRVLRGSVEGGSPIERCNLVVEDGRITGDISAASGHFRILPIGPGDTHAVIEVRSSGFRPEGEPIEPPGRARRKRDGSVRELKTPLCDVPPAPGHRAKVLGPVTVMIVYTPAAEADAGGARGIQIDIESLMTQLSDAFALTGGNFKVRTKLARAVKIEYVEGATMSGDLSRLRKPDDPVFKTVHALRDLYRADLVHLLIKAKAEDVCGLGYISKDVTIQDAVWAFSMSDRQCAVGNYSFAHEIGHNLGMDHDRYETNESEHKPQPGDFNFGYVLLSHGVRSLLAYEKVCRLQNKECPRAVAYSTPRLQLNDGTPFGRPLGDPEAAYNVEALCRAGGIVSKFR